MTKISLAPKTAICVTGGDGFLGRHLVSLLDARGYSNVFVPRIEDYNLLYIEDIRRIEVVP